MTEKFLEAWCDFQKNQEKIVNKKSTTKDEDNLGKEESSVKEQEIGDTEIGTLKDIFDIGEDEFNTSRDLFHEFIDNNQDRFEELSNLDEIWS